VNTNRNFIGIEMEENYYKIAEQRISSTVPPDELAHNIPQTVSVSAILTE
jgi:DNA modification methylase